MGAQSRAEGEKTAELLPEGQVKVRGVELVWLEQRWARSLVGLDAVVQVCYTQFGHCTGARYDVSEREVSQSAETHVNAEVGSFVRYPSHKRRRCRLRRVGGTHLTGDMRSEEAT